MLLLEQFKHPSPLRIVIATIAFGIDINCPDVCQIIHWGVPQNAAMYFQESGRAGRDGKLSCALLLTSEKAIVRAVFRLNKDLFNIPKKECFLIITSQLLPDNHFCCN